MKISSRKSSDLLRWLLTAVMAVAGTYWILYPGLGGLLGTTHPLITVSSTSMEHNASFDTWWERHEEFYLKHNITKEQFRYYPFSDGLNKGDLIVVLGRDSDQLETGDVVAFTQGRDVPLVHRIVDRNGSAFETRGDGNEEQLLSDAVNEYNITPDELHGEAIIRVPYVGYIKLLVSR